MSNWTLYPYNRCRLASTVVVDANPGAASGYGIANTYDMDRQTYWAGANTTHGYVTYNFGAATTIGAVAFANHNLKTITSAITIQCDDEATFTAPTTVTPTGGWTSPFTVTSDDDFLLTFTTETFQYWRIYFDGLDAVPKVGEIALLSMDAADHIAFSTSVPLYPVTRGWRRRVNISETEGGILHVTQRGVGAAAHVASKTQEPRRFVLNFDMVDGAAANSHRANIASWMRYLDGMWRPMWLTANDWSGVTGTPAYHVVLTGGDFDEALVAPANRNSFSLELVTAL